MRVATSFYLFQAEAPSGKGPVAGEAIDDTTYFHVYGELPIARSDVERFAADPRGALVSKALADRLQLHVGDQLVLSGVLYPGEWRFDVLAVYPDSSERGFFYFHEGQLREHPTASALYDGRVGDIMACVDDPARAGEVQHSIQRALGEPDGPTETLYTWPAYAPDAGGTWGPK